jgi:hypothetical protein
MNNIFEEFLEKKNFEQWLVEKKKETKKNKVDIDDFVDQYGEEDGKSIYYRAMKRKSKGKKKINEALLTALVGGAVAAAIGLRALNRYGNVNKDLNDRLDVHRTRYGQPAGPAARERYKAASTEAQRQAEIKPFEDRFRPEIRLQTRQPNGRAGPVVTQQTRGTTRQWVKDRVSYALQGHPIIHGVAMNLGSKIAKGIHDKFTSPQRV